MKSGRRFAFIPILLLVAAGALTMAAQQSTLSYPTNSSASTSSDPPGRVARIQYMSGEVSIQPGGVNDWMAASVNRPLTSSDRVWTDANSKAELSVGGGYIRLNSEASLTLTAVTDQTVQMELDQGTLELTVRYLGPGQIYEVDTANLAFTVMKPGVYRFDVFPQEDATWVTVRKGSGEATGRGNAVKVKSGEQVRFGNGASLQHTAEAAPEPDGFDDWASVRDKRLESSVSAQYVSPGVIGYEDLDTYGSWQTTASYGAVWVPYSVPVGWAPYRFGRWAWISPWGWTWIDNAAWGFAPFHYGRWVYTGGYWGWAPGPYRWWRPCYAPALVGWVGGAGWGFGFGFGGGWGAGVNFGWFPLGWGEPFYPWYRGWHGHGLSPAYIRKVNVTNTRIANVTNITNNYYNNHFTNIHYANKNVSGAVTAAPGSAIAKGEPIDRVGQTLSKSALMHAPAVRSINAMPTRAAYSGGQPVAQRALPPASVAGHHVGTHAMPPVGVGDSPGYLGFGDRPGNAAAGVHRPPAVSSGNVDFAGHPGSTVSSSVAPHAPPRPTYTPSRSPAVPGAPAAMGNSFALHPASEPRAVPRPPAGYSYHAAPGYAGERHSDSALTIPGGHPTGSSYAPATRLYSPAPGYSGQGHYAGTTPYIPTQHVPAAMPGHVSPFGGGAAPHMSAPGGAVHMPAPGGAVHMSAPGGGSSHAMHASGGRSR